MLNSPEERTAVIAAHRKVADLLEAHPEIAEPSVWSDGSIRWSLYSFECPDGIPAMVAAIRRAVGGTWTKREQKSVSGADELVFEREGFGVTVGREAVCTRRVVGTEEVTIPAVEAKPARTEVREIVEWDCHPILADEQVPA